MANYGAMLLTTRAHLQENQQYAILRPRLFYVLICISARVRVPGTLVHLITEVLKEYIQLKRRHLNQSHTKPYLVIPVVISIPYVCPGRHWCDQVSPGMGLV